MRILATLVLCGLLQSCGLGWLFNPPSLDPIAAGAETVHDAHRSTAAEAEYLAGELTRVIDKVQNLDPAAKSTLEARRDRSLERVAQNLEQSAGLVDTLIDTLRTLGDVDAIALFNRYRDAYREAKR